MVVSAVDTVGGIDGTLVTLHCLSLLSAVAR